MSLTATNPLVKFGSVALGYFAADKINPMIDKLTGTLDAKIVAGIEVGAGTLLLMGKLGKGKPGMIATVAGGVLAGAGLKRGMRSFGVITGYGMVNVVSGYRPNTALNGYGAVNVVSGYTPNMALTGAKSPANKIMGSVEPGGAGRLNSGSDLLY
jgi:hypothetical protein